ncbi:MAG: Thioredoxin protein [Actinobacteria bacterium]|nr:Thioredoxin protein [Actinomycetota bacterium]
MPSHPTGYAPEIGAKMKNLIPALLLLAAASAFAAEQRFSVPVGNSPAQGPSNAPVTLIEFIDYQ